MLFECLSDSPISFCVQNLSIQFIVSVCSYDTNFTFKIFYTNHLYFVQGGWKCADCVVCTNCGQKDPGLNGKWHANYSVCAPCASLTTCPICNLAYRDEELLVRCALCTRWAHANCDQLRTEDELEIATDLGYNCLLCRELGADLGTGHAQVNLFYLYLLKTIITIYECSIFKIKFLSSVTISSFGVLPMFSV